MKGFKFIPLISISLLLSCFGNEFEREKIIGNYYLTTTDKYQKDIYIDFKLETGDFVGVLRSKIFSVGHNEKYIVAKQHPFLYPTELDKEITNYYIIPVHYYKTLWPEKGIIGPLTLKEFEQRTKQLKINIKFDKEH